MMDIEKGKISNSQLIFLITGHLEGTAFLLSFVANLAGHDTWLTILSALAVTISFGYIYALLIKRFSGLNFARINKIVYGRYLGTVISLLYFYYYLLLISLTLRILGDFYHIFFMRDTPVEIFYIVFTGVCAYATWNGIEVLARIAPIIVASVSVIVIGTALMLLPKMDFSNFMPCGELPLINFIHSTQIIAEIPLGILLSTLLPITFTLNNHQRVVRTISLGLLSGAAFLMVIAIRNTAVLGNTEVLWFSPSFQTARLIDLGFLSRTDVLFATGHALGMFILCTDFYYSAVLFSSQILGLRTYLPMIFPLGCIAVIYGLILYPSTTAHLQSAQNIEIMLFAPFIFIFPPLTLLIAKIRNLPQKGSSE